MTLPRDGLLVSLGEEPLATRHGDFVAHRFLDCSTGEPTLAVTLGDVAADEPLLAKDDVRYKGQPIALVAAEDEETAQEAVEAISLDLNEKPALFDVRKAFDPDAPRIHHWGNWYPHFEDEMDRRQIRKGDVESAFDAADVIVQGVYRPAAIEHVPLETQVCLVVPEASGRLTIYSCTQALYF